MELLYANHCTYKIRSQIVFCTNYHKKFSLNSGTINYLRHVCFEIGKMYCFKFDAK